MNEMIITLKSRIKRRRAEVDILEVVISLSFVSCLCVISSLLSSVCLFVYLSLSLPFVTFFPLSFPCLLCLLLVLVLVMSHS